MILCKEKETQRYKEHHHLAFICIFSVLLMINLALTHSHFVHCLLSKRISIKSMVRSLVDHTRKILLLQLKKKKWKKRAKKEGKRTVQDRNLYFMTTEPGFVWKELYIYLTPAGHKNSVNLVDYKLLVFVLLLFASFMVH